MGLGGRSVRFWNNDKRLEYPVYKTGTRNGLILK